MKHAPLADHPPERLPEDSSVLAGVQIPDDLKTLNDTELHRLCRDVRERMIAAVSKTGGHLGAGLGVVELTVAIHAVFNTPRDILIWDVGHQAYPHKILTGRKDRIDTLRQGGGLSGFTKRSESAYDPFGAAHSSTSISAGLGFAVARDKQGGDHHVICVIGDGAMSAGMAYEALNNAGVLKTNLIVILNDNDMSIAPPVGAMSHYLSRLTSSRPYVRARELAKNAVRLLPGLVRAMAAVVEEKFRTGPHGRTLFEELGFYTIGPVDGHNLDDLLTILRNIKATPDYGPVLIHAVTKKGKGYAPAESARDKMHGVSTFDVVSGTQQKPKTILPSYTNVFADQLIRNAARDPAIIAITAAMPSGTGLDRFGHQYPDRMIDVGIAEQHAVTFAGGLAAAGMKPFAAIYSTFLQRAYDQVVHDIAIQNLPVRFAIDRAGLVGADGQTHAGAFDTAYLGCLPNMVLMAASDEAELTRMVHTAALYDDGPIAFRYPRGEGTGAIIDTDPQPLTIGQGRILREGTDIALLSYGGRLQECLIAAQRLGDQHGLSATVADARFAKPLDRALIRQLAGNHRTLITIEEGSIGGFGSFVLHALNDLGLLDGRCRIRTLCLPDRFQDHDKPDRQYHDAGLDAASIIKAACAACAD